MATRDTVNGFRLGAAHDFKIAVEAKMKHSTVVIITLDTVIEIDTVNSLHNSLCIKT